MSAGSSGGGIDGLSDHMLEEIFVNLPSQSVLRCRAVCQRWLRVTSDGSFLAAHAPRRPREMILEAIMHRELSTIPLCPERDGGDPMDERRFLCDLTQRADDGTLTGSCRLLYSLDGLLMLRQRIGLYVICNPVTRQWTNLPPLAPGPCFAALPCGFYRHRRICSSEYRLMCLGLEHEEAPGDCPSIWHRKQSYYILSTAPPAERGGPRHLCRAPPTPREDIVGHDMNPVCYHSILHWFSRHPESSATGKMLAFDTASETFRLMSRPPERGDEWRVLLELDGELSVAAAQEDTSRLDIWALQDYDDCVWVLRHREELPPPLSAPFLITTVLAVGERGAGAILIGGPYGYDGVARLYLINEKKVQMDIRLRGTIASFLVFSESLVQHAFFHESPRCPDLACVIFEGICRAQERCHSLRKE